jgi:hypothetical protein
MSTKVKIFNMMDFKEALPPGREYKGGNIFS